MDNGYNALQIIQNEFPTLVYRQRKGNSVRDLFKVVQNLADYTREQLVKGNIPEIEHCFRVAKQVLAYGSNIAKLAIENVFVYSVSRLLEISVSVSQTERSLFLKFFRKEYEAQVKAGLP